MVHVVFAIPFAMENTLRFARAAASLPGVRLSVVSQDRAERFPAEFRERLVGFEVVGNAMDAGQLGAGVASLGKKVAPVERLLGILEPLQEPLAQVREQLRIRGMDAPTASNFRDKSRMKDLFRAHELPCAGHRLVASVGEAVTFAKEVGLPVVAKPPAGAGAKATARCDTLDDLQRFLQQVPPAKGREVLLEEFVRGREFSYDTVTLHGRHVFHNINCYYPTPLEVMENPWIQWCVVAPRDVEAPEFHDIHRLGPRALSVLGMWTGMSHMEWFRRHDGSIAISEVAARPPGAQFMSLISYACDADMYRAWAQLMVFETWQAPERPFAAGAAYLRGQAREGGGAGRQDLVVRAVHGLEQVQRRFGGMIVETRLPVLGAAPSTSYEGDGFLIVRHPDTRAVTEAVQAIVASMRVELGTA